MLVVDASALVELLLGLPGASAVAAELRRPQVSLHAPDLAAVEVASALRRREAAGLVRTERARQALQDLDELGLARHDSHVLTRRAWMLRRNFTIYDGVYVALTEALGCQLLTTDSRLARAVRRHTAVEALVP